MKHPTFYNWDINYAAFKECPETYSTYPSVLPFGNFQSQEVNFLSIFEVGWYTKLMLATKYFGII